MVQTYSFKTKYDMEGADTKLGFTTDTITLTAGGVAYRPHDIAHQLVL